MISMFSLLVKNVFFWRIVLHKSHVWILYFLINCVLDYLKEDIQFVLILDEGTVKLGR